MSKYVNMLICQYVNIAICQYVNISIRQYVNMSICKYVNMSICNIKNNQTNKQNLPSMLKYVVTMSKDALTMPKV